MADSVGDDDPGATLSEIEEEERDMATPHDHGRGPPPLASAPKGPPVPRPVRSAMAPATTAPSTAVRGHRASDPPNAADDSDQSSGSRLEQRWPLLGADRVQGPHRPDGRFGSTTSFDTDSDEILAGLSTDSAEAVDSDEVSPGAAGIDGRANPDDDTDENSSTWSSTTLVLAGPSLDQAKGTLLGLYRKRLRNGDWASVQAAAQHYLAGEQQEPARSKIPKT
ncbi:Pol [Symbiodinium sp. KB8]|nr:Pol [Symbiodinium sp. KB8]